MAQCSNANRYTNDDLPRVLLYIYTLCNIYMLKYNLHSQTNPYSQQFDFTSRIPSDFLSAAVHLSHAHRPAAVARYPPVSCMFIPQLSFPTASTLTLWTKSTIETRKSANSLRIYGRHKQVAKKPVKINYFRDFVDSVSIKLS